MATGAANAFSNDTSALSLSDSECSEPCTASHVPSHTRTHAHNLHNAAMAPNHLTICAPWTQHSIKRHAQQIRAACACRCVRHCEPSTPPLAPNARLYSRRCRPPLNGVRRQALLTTVCTKPSLYSRCRRCALANQIPRLSKCNKSFLLDRQRTTRNAAKTKMKSTVPNAMPSQQPPRRVLGAWHA